MNKISKEKEFHNKRYDKEIRQGAWKFYSVEKASRKLFEELIVSQSEGKNVLELGCGKNTYLPKIIGKAKSAVGIDISEVAIEYSKNKINELNFTDKADFYVMNAEDLNFEDNSFDLIIGSSIVHHLDLEKFFNQLCRIMSKDGKAVFIEPQGNNILINLYRNLTPKLRTEDEHPLVESDFMLMRKYFNEVKVNYFHMMTLFAVPFRNMKLFPRLLSGLGKMDDILFNLPLFRRQAWQTVIELSKPTN